MEWSSAWKLLCLALIAPLVDHSGVAADRNVRAPGATNAAVEIPTYSCEVIKTWPHDRTAFTQGLIFHQGALLESTGLNGHSTLRKVALQTGRVLRQIELPAQYFAEGLALMGSNLFQITWQNQRCFVYDLETFRKEKEFAYDGEGWGLTSDGESLIMSNGTDQLRFLEPKTFSVTKTLTVKARGQSLYRLNELEFVNGEIFANVWRTDFIARIDPASGNVVGLIDCTRLLPLSDYDASTDVLNGIAYDPAGQRLFITGKHWPKLFEVGL